MNSLFNNYSIQSPTLSDSPLIASTSRIRTSKIKSKKGGYQPINDIDTNSDISDIYIESAQNENDPMLLNEQLDSAAWPSTLYTSVSISSQVNQQQVFDNPIGIDCYKYINSEDRISESYSREYEGTIDGSIQDELEWEDNDDNNQYTMLISVPQPQQIPPNNLNPRQQEEADQPVREGMRYLFDNRFARAKAIFQLNSSR